MSSQSFSILYEESGMETVAFVMENYRVWEKSMKIG